MLTRQPFPTQAMNFLGALIALPVFVIVMAYTYINFFQKPSVGFTWTPEGHVSLVYEPGPNQNALQTGDQLVQVGSVRYADTLKDLWLGLFTDAKPGQVVPITIQRGDQARTVNWVMPGYGWEEFEQRLINNWWLGYVFLLIGTVTLIRARPRDTRWWLFILFNFLTAVWLTAGSTVSYLHLYDGAVVLRVFVWLSIPVYLHLHWEFPKPLARLPRWVWPSLYTVSLALALAQWFQGLPGSLYFAGFAVAVVGSFGLLLGHWFLRPAERRQIWPVFAGGLVGLLPPVLLGTLFAQLRLTSSAPVGTLFFFPLVPLGYFFAIYGHRLGNLELRTNRAMAVYIFLSVVGTLIVGIAAIGSLLPAEPVEPIFIYLLIAVGGALAGIYGFAPFQRFIERTFLGIQLPPEALLEASAARIASSLDLASLTALLRDEITGSLLIRQSALYRLAEGEPTLLYAQGAVQPVTQPALAALVARAGRYLPPEEAATGTPEFAWVQLGLPITFNQQQIGLWLLGRRDPDDYYSQTDIHILQTLANQMAVALAHIQQTEQLRLLYENDINQREVERASLARELHDNALNELSNFKRLTDHLLRSEELNQSYQHVTEALRRSITELQPAAVSYGLQLALLDLADRAGQAVTGGVPRVACHLEEATPGLRFNSFVELHLYRITQQALTNALQHACAKHITVQGHLRDDTIQVAIEDDGIGFEIGGRSDAARLVTRKHFGLAGMYERAQIIGAELEIHSRPNAGARVQISWRPTSG